MSICRKLSFSHFVELTLICEGREHPVSANRLPQQKRFLLTQALADNPPIQNPTPPLPPPKGGIQNPKSKIQKRKSKVKSQKSKGFYHKGFAVC